MPATTPTQTDDRPSRPLAVRLAAEAVAKVGDTPAKNDGRWRLNAGSVMLTYVWGVNMGRDGYPQPIRLVIDLASFQFDAAVVPALYAHSSYALVGNWKNCTVEADGVYGDLTLYKPANDIEAECMADAVRVAALLRQDHPWQCSLGCAPANGLDDYEPCDDDTEINGTTHAADDGSGYPLYVLRNGRGFEASIVLFGADSNTGRVAASLTDPLSHLSALRAQGTPMPTAAPAQDRLKTLLSAHPQHKALVAELFANDPAVTDAAIVGAVKLAGLEAQVATLTSERDALKTERDALAAKLAAAPVKPVVQLGAPAHPPVGGGDETTAPKTFAEARALLAKETGKKGFALNAEVRSRFPGLG